MADRDGAADQERTPQQPPEHAVDGTNTEEQPAASDTANDSHVSSNSSTTLNTLKSTATRLTADVQALKQAVRFDETLQAGTYMLKDMFYRTSEKSETDTEPSASAAFHMPSR